MTTTPHSLLHRVASLIERNREEKFQILDDTGLTVDRDLATSVCLVLEEAVEVLEDIQHYYDQIAAHEHETPPKPSAIANRREDSVPSDVADLAYMSRSELLAIRDALLGSLAANMVWKVLSYADAGLGRSERALIAVNACIREVEGLPADQQIRLNLEDSLVIRRQYALFRRAMERAGSPSGAKLVRSLNGIATHIAALRNLRVYSLLRIDDRRRIRELQKRILAALESQASGAEEDRRVLWKDLQTTADLFMEVNKREELVEHDRRRVLEAYRELFQREPPPSFLPAAIRGQLEALLGRDPELDAILLDGKRCEAASSRGPLARLRAQLAPAAMGPAD
ncbi:MAG: hypothetical protein K8J08_20040 [Thermoanaerobaculia bacterium]|nr:hypothetical protein [Thermoanaerobaculia bacterium]